MSKKSLCLALAVVIVGTIFVSAYLASAAPSDGKGYNRILEKRTFIHYKKGHGKPSWAGGGKGGGKDEEEGYYSYLAKGARWKVTENYRLNPWNNDDAPDIYMAVALGMDAWETAPGVSFDIFGDIKEDYDVTYNGGAYREYNTISFGSYGNSDVIGVATVWGYFSGPPSQREIIEAHILLNDDFVWGDALDNESLMDVQNILTHELGHCAGMGDLYEPAAGEETMYGYSGAGEIKKRDLYIGDEEGIAKLYR
ncbi:MAG: matrixin family metalloprotease [Planctomycetota bacterium]|jgi:hypothetical protein